MIQKLLAPLLAFFAFMIGLAGTAHAALPEKVTQAIDTAGQDLATAAGAVIAAMVAFWGLYKLGSKMRWW